MVNKRENNLLYNFYFRQTAILFLYFFNFIPYCFFFSPYLLRFNFVVSERNVHSLLSTYLGGTFLLFWMFLSGTVFQVGEGGGGGRWLHVHPKNFFVTIISFWHNTIFHQFSTDRFFLFKHILSKRLIKSENAHLRSLHYYNLWKLAHIDLNAM